MQGGCGDFSQLDMAGVVDGAEVSAPYQARLAGRFGKRRVNGFWAFAGGPDVLSVFKQSKVRGQSKIVHALAAPGPGDAGALVI